MGDPADKPRGGPSLFVVSLPFCFVIAVIGIAFQDDFSRVVSDVTGAAFRTLDWFFMLSVTAFLVLSAWLAFGRYGKLKLGRDGDEPEFSTASWLAMLFAAGMGVGLLFWGVAEPMSHYTAPPVGQAGSPDAARKAMVITMFHWGLHAWGIYCMGALVLAYFHHRLGMPYMPGAPIRHVFRGRWVEPVAKTADLVAVLAVTFGVAGSMAMGVLQFHSGLSVVTGIPKESVWIAVGILVLLFISYMTSAATSLDKGIKILSNINMALAILLLLFVLLAGPTAFLMRCLLTAGGDYASQLPGLTFTLYPYSGLGEWMESWTLIYFLWWIGWAPFVGIFVARISRGRTVREFVTGVILAPTVFSLVWFAVFGGTAIFEESSGAGGLGQLVSEDKTTALFSLFDRLPLGTLLGVVAVVLIFIFLVTSVDSATYVLGMLTTRGSFNPPVSRKLAWGIILALLGGALMLTRNIAVVRAGAISFALPLTVVLLLQVGALIKSLRETDPEKTEVPASPGETP